MGGKNCLSILYKLFKIQTKTRYRKKAWNVKSTYDRTELVLAVTFLVLVILIFVGYY